MRRGTIRTSRMRRAATAVLVILAAVALLWLAGSHWMSQPESDAFAEPWPAGLGPAATVAQRYPPTAESEAARALRTFPFPAALRNELGAFMKQQVERASDEVAPLPSATGAFLAAHVAELDALEEMLTTRPIVWQSDFSRGFGAPVPNLRQVLDVNRLLFARALSRHGDPAAWRELHAAWSVSRALLRRPELISALIGLSIARSANAVARDLPSPAPLWREEMLTTDYSRAMVAALQAAAWSTATAIRDHTLVDEDAKHDAAAPLERAFDFLLASQRLRWASELIASDREACASLYGQRACIVPANANAREPEARSARWARHVVSPDGLHGIWRRLGRFRIERELTTKLLQRDFSARSACPDGHWLYDGETLRFSNEPASAANVTEMPLHFRVGAAAPSPDPSARRSPR